MVELLVVMGLAGIVAGGSVLIAPRIDGAIRLETAVHLLAADLRQARTLAVASARRIRLVLREGGVGYVRQASEGSAYLIDQTRLLPVGVAIARVGSGGTLTFSPLGNGENATIVLEHRSGIQRALVINQRGRIRIGK